MQEQCLILTGVAPIERRERNAIFLIPSARPLIISWTVRLPDADGCGVVWIQTRYLLTTGQMPGRVTLSKATTATRLASSNELD